MSDPDYCYAPDYTILRNLLDIRDAATLDCVERAFVTQRIAEGVPDGDFDLAHLRAIHRHLFQDIFEWAGDIRRVEISKGGHRFQFRRYIETGMADIHHRIVAQNMLRGLSPEEFVDSAGEVIGDLNHVHPFREGNGRTQMLYLEQLGQQAGHAVDLRKMDKAAWIAASREAHLGRYAGMRDCIAAAIGLDPVHWYDHEHD